MAYTNSSLVTYTKLSPNCTKPRNHVIDTITIHCYVGQVTAQQGCNGSRFTTYNPVNGASCNYVVGYDGSIGLCVEEANRSWCSSNRSNDMRAITIEVASDIKAPYAVTDKAFEALVKLVADICNRNNIKKLVWSTNKNTRINHLSGSNMTVHRDYAAKSCPGDYLYSKMGEIASKVNTILSGQIPIDLRDDHVIYRTYSGSKWLGEVTDYNNINGNGYAGNDQSPVSGIAITTTKDCITYRVHSEGKWLPWVTGYNIKDNKNGYAGNLGKPIDAIQIKPIDGYDVRYRVSTIGTATYLPWVTNYNLTNGNGYAGSIGKTIDKVQIELIKK